MNEENNKKKVTIIIASVLLLVTVVIGVSYAYFSARSTSTTKTVTSGTLAITYTDGNLINASNIAPMLPEEGGANIINNAPSYSFSIKNSGTMKMYAEIKLTDITISDELKNGDFKWALYDANQTGMPYAESAGSFSSLLVNDEIVLKRNIEITASTTKNYKLIIFILDTDQDQTTMMGKSFSGKIEVNGTQNKTVPTYTDTSGANTPSLTDDMMPVVYDETNLTWVVADTNAGWYDYDKGIWANAVICENHSCDDLKVGEDINASISGISMFTWIPRYKYKGQDVVFESGTNTTGVKVTDSTAGTTSYYTHPSFRNGNSNYKTTAYDQGGWDSEITGFWFSKFRSGDDDNNYTNNTSTTLVSSVASLQSLTNMSIKDQFDAVKNMENSYGLSSGDIHMSKGTEWSAVEKLGYSKYGKGNQNIHSSNAINPSSNNNGILVTGCSDGGAWDLDVPISNNFGNYYKQFSNTWSIETSLPNNCMFEYDNNSSFWDSAMLIVWTNWDDNGNMFGTGSLGGGGTSASTTGTIYGVYDTEVRTRSNGNTNYENVMTVYNNNISNSEFDSTWLSNNKKYYDKYTTNDISDIKGLYLVGDSFTESESWLSLGGNPGWGNGTSDGSASKYNSFRVTLINK